jgi:hypothetical protein
MSDLASSQQLTVSLKDRFESDRCFFTEASVVHSRALGFAACEYLRSRTPVAITVWLRSIQIPIDVADVPVHPDPQRGWRSKMRQPGRHRLIQYG